jgi:tetratricopeptide (TPR) repeat protein
VLAHSTLATIDVIAMTAATFATYALWRVSARPTYSAALVAGACTGAALCTKFTLIAFVPAWIAAALWTLGPRTGAAAPSRLQRAARVLTRGGAFAVVAATAWAVVCTAYLWRGVFSPALALSDLRSAALFVFPEQFGRSLLGAGTHAVGGHFAYLCGARSASGFVQYFLIAACVKWTIPFLAILSIGSTFMIRRRRWPSRAEVFLIAPPVALFLVASLVSRVDIGVRHLLPMMPLLAELGGVTVARLARTGRAGLAVGAALVVAHVVTGAMARAHPLAYFNALAGGTARGDRFLIDSNIDWGTEEPAARAALERDSTLVLVPDPRTPAPGRVLVNVNALRGLFELAASPYWWLEDLAPDAIASPAWRVYRVDPEMPPPPELTTEQRALFLAAVASRAEWARVVANPAVGAEDPRVRADALLVQARASRALGDDRAARDALDRARGHWDDRFAAESARLDARAARGGRVAYYQGRALSLSGDHAGAIRSFVRALSDPAAADAARYGLALEAIHRGQLAIADTLLSAGARPPDGTADAVHRAVRSARAQRASPRATDHVRLARWFASRGAFDAAFDEAEVALALDGASQEAIAFLGSLAVDEKCGRALLERHGADRGFVLSELRRAHRARLAAAWDSTSLISGE